MNGAEIRAEDQLTGSEASDDCAILNRIEHLPTKVVWLFLWVSVLGLSKFVHASLRQMGRMPDERRYLRIERLARRATAPAEPS
jgi:hypothetical protein